MKDTQRSVFNSDIVYSLNIILLVIACSGCVSPQYPENAVVIVQTFTPAPTPDYFATENGMTSEEMLEFMNEVLDEDPTSLEKEAVLDRTLRTIVSGDSASNALKKYFPQITLEVEDNEISFIVHGRIDNADDFETLIYDLLIVAVISSTDDNQDLIWDVSEINILMIDSIDQTQYYWTGVDVQEFLDGSNPWYSLKTRFLDPQD